MEGYRIDVTQRPDPEKLFEMLSRLETDPAARERVESALKAAAENYQGSQPGAPREEVLASYRKSRREFMKLAQTPLFLATTQSWDVKPSGRRAAEGLKPIRIRDMQVGATHRGRVLEGSIIEEPLFTGSSACFILEDAFGDLIRLAVYNVPGMNWHVAQRVFPKGRKINIKEPYYKVFGDGSTGLRVDNPSEITDRRSSPEMSWKEQGDKCEEPQAALDAYMKGWEEMRPQREEMAVLLTNRAICASKLESDEKMLRAAAIATLLNPANEKSKHWVTEGLRRFPRTAAEGPASFSKKKKKGKDVEVQARWCTVQGVVEWCPPVPEVTQQQGSGRPERWKELKDAAKLLFEQQRWVEADEKYQDAVVHHPGRAAVAELLKQMAAKFLALQLFHKAVEFCCAAGMLPPASEKDSAKLWICRAWALEGLAHPAASEALAFVPLESVRAEEKELRGRAELRQKVEPISKVTTKDQYEGGEGWLKGMLAADEKMSGGEAAAFRHMFDAAPRKMKDKMEQAFGPLVGRKVPEYHQDFAKECGWSVIDSEDVGLCQKLLFDGYGSALMLPWSLEASIKSGEKDFTHADLVKRFHGVENLKWFLENLPMEPGRVIPSREVHRELKYCDAIRLSFSNHPPRKEILHRGTVHVSVGFNDLGQLLNCALVGPPRNRSGPLRFVGIDASPYAVAKSLVIAAMLKDGTIPISHCLQAWFSSSWSRSTAEEFTAHASELAKKPQQNRKVHSYLCHWASAPQVPLMRARHLRLKTRVAPDTTPASLVRHKDRMALCQYILTGEILGGEEAEVGSLAMWSVPPNSPPIADDESLFQAVEINEVPVEPKKLDIFQRTSKLLLGRLDLLRKRLLDAEVEIDLRCDFVAAGERVVDEIAALHPWTMSWSNCLDYMPPSKFHELARDCSRNGDTIHFGYSMNWIAEVCGSCILDYPDLKFRSLLIDMTNDYLTQTQAIFPWMQYIVCPPHENPVNTTGYVLATHFHEKWARHFFRKEIAGDVQLGMVSMHTYSIFARTCTNVSMTWTYDPEVKMQPQSPDDPFGHIFASLFSQMG